jgi:hypothetical protein
MSMLDLQRSSANSSLNGAGRESTGLDRNASRLLDTLGDRVANTLKLNDAPAGLGGLAQNSAAKPLDLNNGLIAKTFGISLPGAVHNSLV